MAQESRDKVVVGKDLEVERLSDNVWRHISYQELETFGRSPGNGLVVLAGDETVLIDTLEGHGFKVLSEARPKDTDPVEYAQKVAAQIKQLRSGGVPPENITVVGASKGAGITVLVSDLLEDEVEINYVLLAICSPMMLDFWQARDICVRGNVLSIFDEKDKLAGSCREFFRLCEGSGLRRHREVELKVGTGHGIVYRPLEEWIQPLLDWTK